MPPIDAPPGPADPPRGTAAKARRRSTASGSPRPRQPRRWLRLLARACEAVVFAMALGALLLWCSVPSTAALADENPTSTAFIDLRRAEAEGAQRTFELKWQWRPLGKISRYLRAGVIYAEDYNFYRHDGVDWGAIEDAFESNWSSGRLAIGGSTITQQLAKNLYLSPSRSVIRKARELLIAYALEDHLSKQRILELYLNVVEWGDGVFGAEAAARHWFRHSAQSLSPSEAARLAIALPNPIQRAPNVRTPQLVRKAVRIIRQFRIHGLIDAAQERQALDEVGATDERVLPSRGAARPPAGQPGGPGAPAEPGAGQPGEPPRSGELPSGESPPGTPEPGTPEPGAPEPGAPEPGTPAPPSATE